MYMYLPCTSFFIHMCTFTLYFHISTIITCMYMYCTCTYQPFEHVSEQRLVVIENIIYQLHIHYTCTCTNCVLRSDLTCIYKLGQDCTCTAHVHVYVPASTSFFIHMCTFTLYFHFSTIIMYMYVLYMHIPAF